MKKGMKRGLLLTVGILIVVGFGGKFAFDFAANKAMDKVAAQITDNPYVKKALDDKNVQAKIEEAAKSVQTPGSINGSHTVHFKDNSEAVGYAMKRLSISEINKYRSMVTDGVTPEEEKQLKEAVFSKFTPDEIRAFIETAQKNK
ncbi:hypothetical protein [Aneurinibacillus tyrosinisolvens]|uniref:hypothetical protein n=1 Tax=Aneurinibacillus tyrosinisolvens TaxID=1443435 RepID=UPI00063F7D3F|nr:hypothetical protein [Aneurinibacillus tyrosinisolvens]